MSLRDFLKIKRGDSAKDNGNTLPIEAKNNYTRCREIQRGRECLLNKQTLIL